MPAAHRVAISNHRLLSVDENQVTFRRKDYAHQSKCRDMTLTLEEFLRCVLRLFYPRVLLQLPDRSARMARYIIELHHFTFQYFGQTMVCVTVSPPRTSIGVCKVSYFRSPYFRSYDFLALNLENC